MFTPMFIKKNDDNSLDTGFHPVIGFGAIASLLTDWFQEVQEGSEKKIELPDPEQCCKKSYQC